MHVTITNFKGRSTSYYTWPIFANYMTFYLWDISTLGADTMMCYSYFRNGISTLPTFYKTLWKLTNHMVLYLCKQKKSKRTYNKKKPIQKIF